jgi:hypothetical protein
MKSGETDVLVELVAQSIHAALVPVRASVAELTTRLAALEARPVGAVKDAGTWKPDRPYDEGDIVTRDGSAWICGRSHISTARFDHQAFRLFVKSGRDGRDGKDAR